MTTIPSGTNLSTILDSHLVDKKLGETELNNISKNQLKKIKKKEKWLAHKSEKRLKERLKAKEKRAFARAHNINLGPSRKSLKKCTMENSSCKLTITIDMGFDDLMIEKDIAKLIKQILRCYTLNRRAPAPIQFSLTNFNNKSKEQMEKHNGYEHWDVKFFSESYCKVYDSKKIIYLTSESENIIDKLDHDSVYVIGGLVDHNGHKGLCHKLAVQAGVQHARLPLDKFLNMKTRKVLAVNHVFEIMLLITKGKTWQDAFLQVLPLRKNAKLVTQDDKDEINSSIESSD
ncbi:Similar to trmt10a: tRNA methyltransferase 10 homolog A (Drosophila melanogaster) [Cotesia congregata]|uniref:tRNA (guanine(9)-N(1))-methyltransferase n=1 Tax=Cotesia congregata TaxID=51543 RepID=A0A8J2MYQ6_COTCN|nr:Similar to trmt10a: tRNA methyltransferase 10 homolog A (Drosophila melanogaster) [Cotesia congregata]